MQFIAEKSRKKNITATYLVIPSLLEKSTCHVEIKIVLSHVSHINNPLEAVNTRNGTNQKKRDGANLILPPWKYQAERFFV